MVAIILIIHSTALVCKIHTCVHLFGNNRFKRVGQNIGARHNNFDAFAHIDYMCRYMPYADKELILGEAPELFDQVFKLLIAKEKPLEINTRRLDDAGAMAALLAVYRRYAQLGGKYAVIGSDAHYKEHVGRRMREALGLADEAGLEPVYFRERKMRKMRS